MDSRRLSELGRVIAAFALGVWLPGASQGATFTPTNFTPPDVTTVIPKLTMGWTLDPANGLERQLFDTVGPGATYSLQHCGTYVRFNIDPYWDRVVFARNDWQVGHYGAEGSGPQQFKNPSDLDLYYNGTIVIADTGNDRLRFLDWISNIIYNPSSSTPCTTSPGASPISIIDRGFLGPSDGFHFLKPQGVSVDDAGTPVESPGTNTDDIIWVADTGNDRIYQLHVNFAQSTAESIGVYGSHGGGTGQFNAPRRVVRGRAATNGDPATTRNTDNLYVLDAGNHRLVKLHCGLTQSVNAATWVKAVIFAPVAVLNSVSVDAWGNLYVTDARFNVVYKLSPDLDILDTYGQAGVGVKTGELWGPTDFRPTFLQKNWMNPPQLVGTSFATLAEYWGENSGGQGYVLGVAIQDATTSTVPSGVWLHFVLPEHAFLGTTVMDNSGTVIRTLETGATFHSSGPDSVFWDGRRDNGTPVGCGTYRIHVVPRSGYVAGYDSTEAVTVPVDFGAPVAATLRIKTQPPNGEFYLNGQRLNAGTNGYAASCSTCTPSALKSLLAPLTQTIAGVRYRFVSWSNGNAVSQDVAVHGDSTITLNLAVDDAAPALLQSPFLSADVGLDPRGIAVSDFNQDGLNDVIVANNGSNTLSVLLGRGDGTFLPAATASVAGPPRALAASDLNGDGRLDLAVACETANAVQLLFGVGGGVFTSGGLLATGQTPTAVAVGDVTGDAKPDIVATIRTTGTVSVFAQTSGGAFGPRSDFSVGGGPVAVGIGRLRNTYPNLIDIVVADSSSNDVKVLPGNGTGGFLSPVSYSSGSGPWDLKVVDLNGDGSQDVVVANRAAASVSVLKGNGTGTLAAHQDYAAGPAPSSVAVADINRDGIQDIAVTDYGPGANAVAVLLGSQGGSYGAPLSIRTNRSPFALSLADVNSDQRVDIVALCPVINSVAVHLGNGDATFGTTREFATGAGSLGLDLADLNNDGKLDLAVANSGSNTVSILLGNGLGGFSTKVDYSTGLNPTDVRAVDLSGDGLRDLIVANSTSNTVSVFRGTGGGSFGTPTDYPTDYYPGGSAVGDLNSDGIPDVVTTTNGAVAVRLGIGAGILGDRVDLLDGSYPVLTDLNGDGKLDLILRRTAIDVLYGDGLGGFGAPVHLFTPAQALGEFVVADLNSDGKKDIVTSDDMVVYMNVGNQVFIPDQTYPCSGFGLAVADVTGDGKLDLIGSDYVSNLVCLLAGHGDGTFAPPTSFGTTLEAPVTVRVGDINLDGAKDVATAAWGAGGASVLLSQLNITGSTAAAAVPKVVALLQNRPNPFNPETSIDFDLPTMSRASLRIFSAQGRLVTTLVDGVLPAGRHTARWKGTSQDGRTVASGIYFYRLVAGGRALSRKMVLLK